MLLLGRGTAEEKLAEFIVRWRARAGRKGALANLVPLPMSRRDIADFLGLTIETVSRIITKLERENVVRVTSEGLQLMGSTERPLLFERCRRIG
jgi:CRP/FNR family transcriptional regulator, anaerobic regulatory protein